MVLVCAVRGYSCFAKGEVDDVRSQISPLNKIRYSGYSSLMAMINGNLKSSILVFGFMGASFFDFKPF